MKEEKKEILNNYLNMNSCNVLENTEHAEDEVIDSTIPNTLVH